MLTKTQPKFKVGDYIAAPHYVFLQVMAVITDGMQPVYCLFGPPNPSSKKGDRVSYMWSTEFELLEKEMKVGKPDFEGCRKLQPGDVLRVLSQDNEEQYTHVLARVDQMVLLSDVPHSHDVKTVSKLAEQIKELTDDKIDLMDNKELKDELRKHGSSTWAKNIATEWYSVENVALMNWKVVGE